VVGEDVREAEEMKGECLMEVEGDPEDKDEGEKRGEEEGEAVDGSGGGEMMVRA
jgi:hypothetical protein